MTLVDRYLRAVRDHLPRAEQDDIINELSDNLQSRMEDEAADRGHPCPRTRRRPSSRSSGTRWPSRPAIAATSGR